MTRGSATSKSLLLVVVILAGAMLWALWPQGQNFEQATGLEGWSYWSDIKAFFGLEAEKVREAALDTVEKAQIEAWLLQENLNRYGDPQDTVYTGGSPLFDEKTGEYIDRIDYIIEQHPDRPWQVIDVGEVKGVYDVNLVPYTGQTSMNQFVYRQLRDSLSDECADVYIYYLGEPDKVFKKLEICTDSVTKFDVIGDWLVLGTRCNREYKRNILTGQEIIDSNGICPGSLSEK
jgi:hypothetical protein